MTFYLKNKNYGLWKKSQGEKKYWCYTKTLHYFPILEDGMKHQKKTKFGAHNQHSGPLWVFRGIMWSFSQTSQNTTVVLLKRWKWRANDPTSADFELVSIKEASTKTNTGSFIVFVFCSLMLMFAVLGHKQTVKGSELYLLIGCVSV